MAEKTKTETKAVAEMPEEKVEKPVAEEAKIRRNYVLPKNAVSDRKHHPVIVNGKVYQVQVGVPIDLPEAVAQTLDNAIMAKAKAEEAIERAQKRSE